jgi:hypothetical protein
MRVAVLVPRRPDGATRDRVWSFIADRWASEHPTWDVIEGLHETGPFNRSAAINTAAAAAGEFDVAIVADADSFVGADQSLAAVQTAMATGQITFAYDRFVYLAEEMSGRVIGGHTGNWWSGVQWTMTGTCSSMVVVPRALWDMVGGFDDGFVGWGMEDVAFSIAAHSAGGGGQRVHGDVWHLWHPTSPENHHESPLYQANVERMHRYETARDGGWPAVQELLVELGVVPAPKPAPKKRATAAKATVG